MAAHHRHQSSLEGYISFSSSPPLEDDARARAEDTFYRVIHHFEKTQPIATGQYSRPRLLRYTYEYAPSEKSKGNVLQAVLGVIGVDIKDSAATEIDLSQESVEHEVVAKLTGFADYLIDNFFLPLKASTRRTPQPSPAYHSATQSTRAGGQSFIGTTARLKTLRGQCLQRDRHRCVVSRRFDQEQASKRERQHGINAQDDDGRPLAGQSFDSLEVAHILPHSLAKTDVDHQLNESREAALKILNMFDNDVAFLIEGPDIDRPRNAITLTHGLHLFFGSFEIFFEPVIDGEPHTYRIDTFLPLTLGYLLPLTRTLYLTEERVIEPPSPRLLALHRAIAHILHLSGAGAYIDKILEDAEEQLIQADGSTPLGLLVQLRLDKWLAA